MFKWLYKKLKKKYDPYLPEQYVVHLYDENGLIKSIQPFHCSVGMIFLMRYEIAVDYSI